jgi:hypothetical protein
MVAFPPHLQLAFPVASELALSACTYGLRFGDCFRLQFCQPSGFEFISLACGRCVSACVFDSGLRYGCLSLSITSISSRACSMLTACIGHSTFDCDSFDLVVHFAASIPIVFFACRPYVYGHYRQPVTSLVSCALDIGCHLSLRFSSLSA